jgi:hypothetical protein
MILPPLVFPGLTNTLCLRLPFVHAKIQNRNRTGVQNQALFVAHVNGS